jgi:uncharacterized membrane protein YqiK
MHPEIRRAYELLDQADTERAETPVDMVQRRDSLEEPLQADWSGCRSVGEMSEQQFSAWVDAGRPRLAGDIEAERRKVERRQAAELQRRTEEREAAERRTASASASAPTPMYVLGEWLAEQMNLVEQELRRECDQKIVELRNEVEALRAEIRVRAEVEALRSDIEALRGERRLRVVP